MPNSADQTKRERVVRIKKVDDDKRIVFGEVYAPNQLDTYQEFMLAEDIETMAYRFMQLELAQTIDTNHDNVPNGSFPVESFIARAGDPDYTEGAWVLGVKVPDDETWAAIKRGELNGFSFEALVRPVEMEVEYFVTRDHVGATEKSEDHDHAYYVQLDERGMVTRGWTSPGPDGHVHLIRRASVTDVVNDHSHRWFM